MAGGHRKMGTAVGGFDRDDGIGLGSRRAETAKIPVPGKHANTDALETGAPAPTTSVPGRRSSTERFEAAGMYGSPGPYAESVFGGGASPGATAQPAAAAPTRTPAGAGGAADATFTEFRVQNFTRDQNGTTYSDFTGLDPNDGQLHLAVFSSGFQAAADVTALTPNARRYSTGFLQTIHRSDRRAIYTDADGAVVGTYGASRGEMMDQRTDLRSPPPWYNWGVPLGEQTRHVAMSDNPHFDFPQYTADYGGTIARVEGSESFTTYLVAMIDDHHIVYLGNVRWNINWQGRFDASRHLQGGHATSIGSVSHSASGNAVTQGDPANRAHSGDGWLSVATRAPAAAARQPAGGSTPAPATNSTPSAGRSAHAAEADHATENAYGGPEPAKKKGDSKADKDAEIKKKLDAIRLPDGVNHRLTGTSGDQIVRTSWWMDGAKETKSGAYSNPPKMRELNTELKKLFWWMTDAQIEASDRHVIDGGPFEYEFFVTSLESRTFQAFGLPPGTEIVWRVEADGGVSLILSIRNAGLENPPVDGYTEYKVSPELTKQIDASFVATFGLQPKSHLLADSTMEIHPKHWAFVLFYDKKLLERIVGPEWNKANKSAVADPTKEETSIFGGVTFPNSIPIEDREYYVKWMEEAIGKQAPTAATGNVQIDSLLIYHMRQLDKDTLLKEKVIERMRRAKGGPGFVLDATSFRRLVHETEEEQERIRLGLKPDPGIPPAPADKSKDKPYTTPGQVMTAPRTRFYERPITGKIVNLGSLASVDKSMDFEFQTEDPQGIGFVGVSIKWIASVAGQPTVHSREGNTFHYAHGKPEKWSVSFDKVGKYEITAIVDHQSYWPTTFKTSVEVKPEAERLKEVEDHAFGTFDDKITKRDDSHFFDVSWTNDRFGDNKYTFGSVKEGELPADFKPQDLDARLGFMSTDREALEKLIKTYEGKTDRQSKDVVDYAQGALKRLDETKQDIKDDGKDLTNFEVRGAFLSEKNGVRSGDLKLIGLAGSRHKKKEKRVGGKQGETITQEWDQPTVRLHDLSQLYEPKNATYTGEGTDFRSSAELAFIELCKSYPPGRVSLIMEQLTIGGGRPGKTLGFELHTGTAWKDVKSKVWDGKVQMIVNLAAACAAVFVPGVGTLAMVLVTTYNAVDTIDNLATLERKGQATRGDYAGAFVQIGLDIVPFAGELKAVGKLGKTTLFALNAAQVATTVVVVTAEGVAQVRGLRDQKIQEVARLQGEIDVLRAQSDSSLELKQKEKELTAAIKDAQDTAMNVFAEMSKQGLVMMMAPVAFNHMLAGFAKTGGAADLVNNPELFVKGNKGETPHYRPETGKIHGDPDLMTPDLTARLQEQWTLDVYGKHADAANVLGVQPHEVVIKRDKSATKTTIKKNEQGIWEVTTPEAEPHPKMLDEVWAARKQMPDAPKERPAALERGSYEPTMSIDEIIKIDKPVVVGTRMENIGDANAVMQKLAAGDRKALKAIGIDKLPKGFDPRAIEWGLGRLPDGKYIIIRGDHGAVNWGPFPEVQPVAHTHPLRAGKHLKSDGGAVGIHILDLVKGGGANMNNQIHFFPSASDIVFCGHRGLPWHRVDTPYVHIGDGRIGNPVGDFADMPRVSIEIQGAHHAGEFPGPPPPQAVYQAHIVVRDTNGTVIWEGDMIGVDSKVNLIQMGKIPPAWVKPGTGTGGIGETTAGLRKPRTKVEQQAFDDWKQLEKSGKSYGGQFAGEEWYLRYEDGLRYDITTDRWVRPDGRKVKDPQKFDGKQWTSKKVYDYLAGPKSESTFKPFAEMLIAKKIATEKQIMKMIEQHGFISLDEDVVRHALKTEYREKILDHIAKQKTPEARHAEMLDITRRLDSSDKGNITEDWYHREILDGKGEQHVAAKQQALADDQGIDISKNRFVDIVDGSIGREIKSTDAALSADEHAQMLDYARMVDGQAKLLTDSGPKTIKHVRYTFTSPEGARANLKLMQETFKDKALRGRISFELFTPEGKRLPPIKDAADLAAQTWLTQ